ncbi:MAG: ABC transporter permease subunit [Defluviitaleaceae bacterium]|nr:ABC transporter permease subunit [Defluviitaleaceae bacterium]
MLYLFLLIIVKVEFVMRIKKIEKYYHMMLLPGMVLLFLFNIVPMFGIVIAFQNFIPARGILGSDFIGLNNFRTIMLFPEIGRVMRNTVIIAVSKIILGLIVPIIFAVLLNELRWRKLKRTVQTIVYVPNFISWVILSIMFSNLFAYNGLVNQFTGLFGAEPVMFFINNTWFRPLIIGTDVWRTFGFGVIIYLAAITTIDPNMYEAAEIDGANRWHKIWHILLPSIKSTIILMATLSIGNVLNAGFEQILVMYSPLVYETVDIIDTYIFRMGLISLQFSISTAVGLGRSLISFVLLVTSYFLASKFAGYTLF